MGGGGGGNTHSHTPLQRKGGGVERQPHLVKELLPRGAGLDGELQLGVHGRDAHVHLQSARERGGGGGGETAVR